VEELRQITLILLAIGAVIDLAAVAGALYEFRTGRLILPRNPLRRRAPATPEDVRKNGLAFVLNDLSVLPVDLEILPALMLPQVPVRPAVAIAYLIVGLAGISAALLLTLISLQIRQEVRYLPRHKAAAVTVDPQPRATSG
jgi:hypothetical protein